MICVFDSSALLAYLRREPGREVVHGFVVASDSTCLAHALNLAEVYYNQRRDGGEEFAQSELDALAALQVQPREDLDAAFWQDAGRIKADYRRVSLADCCGLALARRVGGTFLTTDKHELDRDEIRALCDIEFIR